MLSQEETIELLSCAKNGDDKSKEKLLEGNSPLIKCIIRRFKNRGVEYDDLYQLACIGFLKAIKNFDLNYNVKFSTYAVPRICGEVKRFLRDDGAVKVSREEKRLSAQLLRERERRADLGLATDIGSLAEAVGISVQDAASALFAGMPVRSLDECVYEDDNAVTLGSMIADEDEAGRVFDRFALRYAVERLGALERRLIVLRYFKDLSQSDTARILGLSQVKVSREEKKILASLKRELT